MPLSSLYVACKVNNISIPAKLENDLRALKEISFGYYQCVNLPNNDTPVAKAEPARTNFPVDATPTPAPTSVSRSIVNGLRLLFEEKKNQKPKPGERLHYSSSYTKTSA